MLKPNVTATSAVALSHKMDNLSNEAYAQSLADKINESAEATEFLAETLTAMENAKRGPISLLWYVVMPSLGFDLIAAGVPFPRSDKETKWTTDDGIVTIRPDKYKASKPGINNSTRNVDAYILDNMAEDLTAVRKARAIIGFCNLAADPVKAGEAPEEFQNMSVDQRDAEKSRAESRITSARRAMRQAVSVWYKAKEIRDNMGDNVDVQFVMIEDSEGNDQLTSSPKAIYIQDKKKATNVQVFLANQFTQLNVVEAMKKGGTYTALKNTLKRERDNNKNKNGKDADNAPVIKSGDGFIANMLESVSWVGGDDPDPSKTAEIIKKISKSPENLLAFGDYAKVIGDIYGAIENDYLLANQKRDAATRAETVNKIGASATAAA